jgi:tRNA threonylcarbamoyladenosine biosynthesis protein TsaE
MTPGSTFSTRSAAETEAAGAELAKSLQAGDVVLVSGDLGAGKTTFVRGACRALGVEGPVTSPTYTIGQVYAAEPEVAHLDLYRLESLGGEDPALLEDYLTPARIGFVEWPAVGEASIDGVVARVAIAHAGGDRRSIEIERVA